MSDPIQQIREALGIGEPLTAAEPTSITLPEAAKRLGFEMRAGDSDFDNGVPINAVLARCGIKPGDNNAELYLPGGAWWHRTPVWWPKRTGIALRGNGLAQGHSEAAYLGSSQHGGPASRLCYNGPADKPAFTYAGFGGRIDGITLQRGEYTGHTAPDDGSVGLCITTRDGVPSGKLSIPSIAVNGFNTAVQTEETMGRGGHADNVHIGLMSVEGCRKVCEWNENQGVDWTIGHLRCGPAVQIVFDCVGCGHATVTFMVLNSTALIARFSKTTFNNGHLKILSGKIDNNAKGWRLVDKASPCHFDFYARLSLSGDSDAADDWVKLPDTTRHHRVDAEFVDLRRGKVLAVKESTFGA